MCLAHPLPTVELCRLLRKAAHILECGGKRVTSTADDGPGSLRQAIATAAPSETINFAVNSPITLTSGQLVIDKDLAILGPGSGTLLIQRSLAPGTPDFRIFHVMDGRSPLPD